MFFFSWTEGKEYFGFKEPTVLQENRTLNVQSVDTPYLSQEGRGKAKISASPRPDSNKSRLLGTPLGLRAPRMP